MPASHNALNRAATVLRFYADKDTDIAAEAWHPSIYDKMRFGTFIEAMNANVRLLLKEGETNLQAFIR